MLHLLRFAFLYAALTTQALSHPGGDLRVEFEPENSETVVSDEINYRFQLVDTKANGLVDSESLKITHEHKLHFIAYDPALKEFQHLHPEFDGTYWQVRMHFNRSGNYWL